MLAVNVILHRKNLLNVARLFKGFSHVHFRAAFCRCAGIQLNRQKKKDNKMTMQLTVFKEVHNTWPAKNGKPAGESYDLLLETAVELCSR